MQVLLIGSRNPRRFICRATESHELTDQLRALESELTVGFLIDRPAEWMTGDVDARCPVLRAQSLHKEWL